MDVLNMGQHWSRQDILSHFNRLARNISNLFGDEGLEWLEGLPGIIANCEQRWALTAC